MKDIVLFDLDGTLVHYYDSGEFSAILTQAIARVQHYLCQKGLPSVSLEAMWQGARDENHEARIRGLHALWPKLQSRDQRLHHCKERTT